MFFFIIKKYLLFFFRNNKGRKFLSGSLAGVTSQTLTYPLDLARARMAVTTKDEYKSLGDVQYLSIDYCYKIILIYNKNVNDYKKRVTPSYLFYDVLYFCWSYP